MSLARVGLLGTNASATTATSGGAPAAPDVAYDNDSEAVANNASSLTFSHTVAATANFLVVSVAHRSTVLRTVTGVTYNGVGMTQVPSSVASRASVFMGSELWSLVAPASGAHNVVVTMSAAADIAGCAVSAANVDTAGTPLGTAVVGNDATANPSVTVGATVGDLVVDACAGTTDGGFLGVGATQTSRAQQVTTTAGQRLSHGCSTEPGTSSVTMSWTRLADNWTQAAVAMKKVP